MVPKIAADEHFTAVQQRGDPASPGFQGAARLETKGVIYPGLIDLHNHIAYDCLPLWASPTREEPWEKRSQWPDDPSYKPKVSLPTRACSTPLDSAAIPGVPSRGRAREMAISRQGGNSGGVARNSPRAASTLRVPLGAALWTADAGMLAIGGSRRVAAVYAGGARSLRVETESRIEGRNAVD